MQILNIILGFLPGFAWLLFYLNEEIHPEPKRLIAITFFAGMASAILALVMQVGLNGIFQLYGIQKLSLFPLMIFAFTEEIVKFVAVFIVMHKNPAFNAPVDAMIYAVVAALGFATIENLGAVTSSPGVQMTIVSNAVTIISLRFIGATLLHSLTSALVGYGWAHGVRELNWRKYLPMAVIGATILHTAFNYLIIVRESAIYPFFFLIFLGFFVLGDFEKLKGRRV